MPDEINKQVTTETSNPVADQVSQTATTTQVPTETETKEAKSDRGNAWVWYLVGIIDLLLALRLIFHLLGAKSVGFADFLYNISSVFIAPFRGIFANPSIEGSYFDSAALLAIVVYVLFGWLIVGLINLIARPVNSNKS